MSANIYGRNAVVVNQHRACVKQKGRDARLCRATFSAQDAVKDETCGKSETLRKKLVK